MDPRLVTLAQNGDEQAFAEIARAISGRLYAIAHRMLRDHDRADDAAQQAIVAIWRDLPSLRDPARFESWAYRITINACYTEVRRARQGHEISSEEMGLATPDDADPDTLISNKHILDATELVRQSLVLAVPMHPVHPDGCPPDAVLRDTDADEAAPTDPRWAALEKLQNGRKEA